VENNTEPQKNY